MPPTVINMLSAVRTRELSLVRRGANNKRFALTKGSPMKFEELVAQVIGTEADGEQQLAESLRKSGHSDEAVEAAVVQYRMAQGFADQVDKGAFELVAKAAGYDLAPKVEPKADKPEPKAAPSQEIPAELAKSLDDKDAKIAELAKSLDDEKRTRVRNELIAECEKSYAHVPGMSAEAQADAILGARAAGGDLEQTLRKSWAETDKAMQESDLLRSAGSPLRENTGGAYEQIGKMVAERVAKSATPLTVAQAEAMVLDENPALYEAYLAEHPEQTGDRR